MGSLADLLELLAGDSCCLRLAQRDLHIWDLGRLDLEQLDKLLDKLAEIHTCIRTFEARIARHGLSRPALFELIDEAVSVELAAGTRRGPWVQAGLTDAAPTPRPLSARCRHTVTILYLRGLEPAEIDQCLWPALLAGDAAAVLASTKAPGPRTSWETARRVVALHHEGKSFGQVAVGAGVSYRTAQTILEKVGEDPRPDESRVNGRILRNRIRYLSTQHPKATYAELRRAYAHKYGEPVPTESQIRNARRGLAPTRRPRAAS